MVPATPGRSRTPAWRWSTAATRTWSTGSSAWAWCRTAWRSPPKCATPWAPSCAGLPVRPATERPPGGLYTPCMDATPGILALVGGGEWQEGCEFDAKFLAASGSTEVLVLPTAAAYEHPEHLVARAGEWFAPLGGQVEGLMVLSRSDAENDGAADIMRRARLIYLAGSSPMHIRSVLKHSA